MFRLLLTVTTAVLLTASCSKEFTKKHNAHFKLNGTDYSCNEDATTAGYYSGDSLLNINAFAGASSTLGASVVVNLRKVGTDVQISASQSGWYGQLTGSARYIPVSGKWKITSHKEGNPASRHTEGNFEFVAVNEYNNTDTLRVTEGYFYVNNY
ncbi:MAG: hypothetical protein RLZZ367_623 [Bacteroidota bacterium]|jgi:hypothetical protein